MGETDPAFQLNSRKPTAGETLPYSARLAAMGVLLGLAPSAYRRLRYGKRDSGNTLGRTALEAGVGATMLGALPWLARSRFKYSVPGTIPLQPKPGETQEAFDERTRIKSWGDVDDRLFIPRSDKKAAFRKVAQAIAARHRDPRNAEEISALFRQHYTPTELAQGQAELATPSAPKAPQRTMWQAHAENQAARENRPVRSVYDEALNNMKQVRNMGVASVGGGALTGLGVALAGPAAALGALKTTGRWGLRGANAIYKMYGANQLRHAVANDLHARELAKSEHPQDITAANHLRAQSWGNLGSGLLAWTPYGYVSKGLSSIPVAARLTSKLPALANLPAALRFGAKAVPVSAQYAATAATSAYSDHHGRRADKYNAMPEAEFLDEYRAAQPEAAAKFDAHQAAAAGAADQPVAAPLVGPTLNNLLAQRGGN